MDYAGFGVAGPLHDIRGLHYIIWNLLLASGNVGHSLCFRQARYGKFCFLNERLSLQTGCRYLTFCLAFPVSKSLGFLVYVVHQPDRLLSCQLRPTFPPAWKECGAVRLSGGAIRLQMGIVC